MRMEEKVKCIYFYQAHTYIYHKDISLPLVHARHASHIFIRARTRTRIE